MLEARPLLARRIAVASLVVDTLFQSFALLGDAETSRSSPSAIYVAYAPHPYVPIGLFSAGFILQIQWLLRLSLPTKDMEEDMSAITLEMESSKPDNGDERQQEPEVAESDDICKTEGVENIPFHHDDDLREHCEHFSTQEPAYFSYLPLYVIGSFLQVGWAVLWMTRHYDYGALILLLNLAIGAHALFWILGGSKNHRYPQSNVFTHLIVKVKIAASVLYLWKTWGAVDILPPPSSTEATLTCVFFVSLALASGPDPTLGLLLAFNLFGLASGQSHYFEWSLLFGWTCLSVGLAVALDWAFGTKSRKILLPQLTKFDDGIGRHVVNVHGAV